MYKRQHVARPLPTWATLGGGAVADPLWGYTRLCDFPSVNRLAKSLDSGYHSEVHNGRAGGVGGDMDWPWTAPRDPVFWSWHLFLDGVFHVWEDHCGALPPTQGDAVTATARVAAPSAMLTMAGALAAASMAGARGRRR